MGNLVTPKVDKITSLIQDENNTNVKKADSGRVYRDNYFSPAILNTLNRTGISSIRKSSTSMLPATRLFGQDLTNVNPDTVQSSTKKGLKKVEYEPATPSLGISSKLSKRTKMDDVVQTVITKNKLKEVDIPLREASKITEHILSETKAIAISRQAFRRELFEELEKTDFPIEFGPNFYNTQLSDNDIRVETFQLANDEIGDDTTTATEMHQDNFNFEFLDDPDNSLSTFSFNIIGDEDIYDSSFESVQFELLPFDE